MTFCENSPVKSSPSYPEIEESEVADDSETLAHREDDASHLNDRESPLIEQTLMLMKEEHDTLGMTSDVGPLNDVTGNAANIERNPSSPPKSSPSFPEEEEGEPMEDVLTHRDQDDEDIERTLMLMKGDSEKMATPLSTASVDKKIHWSSRQVHVLLDCVESRLDQFRNRGVHANVWTKIGEEMATLFPLITTKHCYNKWKNLRRDVRLSLVNPNKSVRNAGVLERVARLVAEIYPNGSDLPLSLPETAVNSPKKTSGPIASSGAIKKKGVSKTTRHPKLTSKHIARQHQQQENLSNKEISSKEKSDGGGSASSPISPPSLPPEMNFPSLLSAAASSLMQDLHGRQSPAPAGNNGQQQNLFTNGLSSLLVNPFVMNPHLFSGLVAAHSMKQQQQTGFSTTSDEEADSFPPLSHEDDSPHDLSRKMSVAPPHQWSVGNQQSHQQQQDSELLEMLRNFHAEETQHAKVIEQMVGMAMDLKTAACRRLSALDDLLMAFAGKHSEDTFI